MNNGRAGQRATVEIWGRAWKRAPRTDKWDAEGAHASRMLKKRRRLAAALQRAQTHRCRGPDTTRRDANSALWRAGAGATIQSEKRGKRAQQAAPLRPEMRRKRAQPLAMALGTGKQRPYEDRMRRRQTRRLEASDTKCLGRILHGEIEGGRDDAGVRTRTSREFAASEFCPR